MKSVEDMAYNPLAEKVVKVLGLKTQCDDLLFFRVMFGFYLTQIASSMRAKINSPDRGIVPINMYALCCAESGFGKGHSTSIVENEILKGFRDNYKITAAKVAETNVAKIAQQRAARKSTDPDDELVKAQKEHESLGSIPFSFDSGTVPAFKQVRYNALLTEIGSLNFICDEIGSNLLGNAELLTAFLECYDLGKIKEKITKNTAENKRLEEIEGSVPTNMLLFGTPDALMDGGIVERALRQFMTNGYARRCFFAHGKKDPKARKQTAEELFHQLTDKSVSADLQAVAQQIEALGDIGHYNRVIDVPQDTAIELLEYKLQCEAIADALPEHEQLRKAEINHRSWKVLKLAGAYAFVEGMPIITMDHVEAAIKLAEESGTAFDMILKPVPNYVKLAKYISSVDTELTHVELMENLPFYPASNNQRMDLLNNSISYGYKNNIIIKKSFSDGIEFISGESLKETNLDEIILSYSKDIVNGYEPEEVKFSELHKLTQAQGFHWVNHHLIDKYRKEENAIAGCNTFVIDVDGTDKVETVKALLSEYTYHLYTTKSHSPDKHCFRVIIPLSHTVKLDAKEYKEFTSNIMEFLPFDMDTQTNQRARKWLSNKGHFEYNEGELLDVLPFIPKTSRNEQRIQDLKNQGNLSALERWMLTRGNDGNRNNMLLKYALMLTDTGRDYTAVQSMVLEFNNKLSPPLSEAEVMATVMRTVAKRAVP